MRPRLLVTALGFAVLSASTAGAQDAAQSAAQSSPPCHRCLNGFRFVPSSVVDEPFTNTSFQNGTGGGMALDLKVPVRSLAGDTVNTLTGNIGFFLLDFEYQKSITKWLALRAGVSGIGRLGTSLEALVASGLSAAFGGSIGATVPIWTKPNFLISAVGDLRNNKQWQVDPYTFAKDIADSGYTPGAKAVLLASESVNRWSVGLRGAWAIKPWVGLSGVLEPGGTTARRRAINRSTRSAHSSASTSTSSVGF